MIKKRLFGILLSLALMIGMMPAMGVPQAAYADGSLTWAALQDQITNATSGSTVTLTSNVTAGENDSALTVPEGKTITLDLAGHTIDRNLNEEVEDGNVITVEGSLTLTDSSSGKTGVVTGGKNKEDGGGIIIGNDEIENDDSTFTIKSGTISHNSGGTNGGGVYIDQGTFIMDGGTISNNTAEIGGGVSPNNDDNALFLMNDGVISDNKANYGGGVYVDGGIFTMKGGSITKNSTTEKTGEYRHEGGGVHIITGTFSIEGGSITNNTAHDKGGGVYSKPDFTMTGGTIAGNTASGYDGQGGGVYSEGDLKMTGGTISDNTADDGGGIYMEESSLTMTDGMISKNTADDGGGVYLVENSSLAMSGGKIRNNEAGDGSEGGGIYTEGNTNFTMTGTSAIENNKSGEDGGGIAVRGEFTMDSDKAVISGNEAATRGGGINVDGNGTINMKRGSIKDNIADYQGGGVYFIGGTFNIRGGSITGNLITNSDQEDDAEGAGVYMDNSGDALNLSGSPVITGNKNDKGDSNVYLEYKDITIDNQLTSGASVGVKMETETGEFTSGYKKYSGGKAPSRIFSSDDIRYAPDYTEDGNEARLTIAYTVRFDANGHGTAPADQHVAAGDTLKKPEDPTAAGYTFDGWFKESACQNAWDFDNDTVPANNDTILYAKWLKNAVPAAVTANNREYDGTAKPLVTVAGEAEGGEMWYALGKDAKTAPEDGWSKSVPTGTDVGTYYVWYKAVGDDSHGDSEPACVKVTIKEKPQPGPTPKPTPTPKPDPKPTPKPAKVSGKVMAKMKAKGKSKLVIRWNKVKVAKGYDIFFAKCNHKGKKNVFKKVKNIKGNKRFKWTKSELKKGTSYKAFVKAYVKKNGKKKYVSKSPVMHAYTANGTGEYTNAKSVKAKKAKVTLKKGKTFKIKARVTKVTKGKRLMPKAHVAKLRYLSKNKKVATVSKNGRIKAKKEGKCTIYAYAHNGVCKKIKVTVK